MELQPTREKTASSLPSCAGVMIIYLLIIADMLIGSAPDYGGVLPVAFGRFDNPWFLSRPFVVRADGPSFNIKTNTEAVRQW